ncbi:hypothetical protein HELRODRAFT_62577, partial [Helobdella robusta]|uniref:HIT domain-containing protein n=1 Tax=Helobdella robusta TaxID=6412 RepID=T1FX25_HELRO
LEKQSTGFWSDGLKKAMNDPELKLFEDDHITIIKDKYPKAKHHYLVLPKDNIANLKALNSSHIPLLKHMHDKALDLCKNSESKWSFKFGYHAIPSMSHIHLHAISKDFNSTCLKTKKHWNSFNTEYFIESSDLIKKLEIEGSVSYDKAKYDVLLKSNLKCHLCSKELNTIPALKEHLLKHEPS